MAKRVYRSKIGMWVWVILIVTFGVIFFLLKRCHGVMQYQYAEESLQCILS